MHHARSGALILRYHRVADLERDPYGIAVSPRHFAEHLDLLRRRYTPIRVGDVVAGLTAGSAPGGGVALTFDDGYADLFHTARPLLERYDMPAMAYVVTGPLEQHTEYWWDTLQRIFMETDPLPPRLDVRIGRSRLVADLTPDGAQNGNGTAASVLHELFDRLRRLDDGPRDAAMQCLATWAGLEPAPRASHRLLRSDEVVALDRDSPIEIGAHTVTHPMLSRVGVARRAKEIAESKHHLEALLGHPVLSFAYPFGTGTGTARTVRRTGFTSACTTRGRLVSRRSDPFRLPRIYVGDWDGEELERRLAMLQ